jgi:hypothetical protein
MMESAPKLFFNACFFASLAENHRNSTSQKTVFDYRIFLTISK